MSILIKGMEMPTNCWFCSVKSWDDDEYVCPFSGRMVKSGDVNRHEDCPLIELPDHGDLIDESEKVDAQYYDDELEEWSIKTKTVGDVLAELCEVPPKVVIPAERSEE